jgi:hypothetical protein
LILILLSIWRGSCINSSLRRATDFDRPLAIAFKEKKNMSRSITSLGLATTLLILSSTASAALIETTLGNAAPGYNDGDTPPVFALNQTGPAPFDTSYGTDGLFGGNFNAAWAFSYAPIADAILSAELSIGIYDHDSAASGSQVGSYSVNGSDLTAGLDTLFEASGGADGQYNVYSMSLGAGLFASLASGSTSVSLALKGPGIVPVLFGGGFTETATNGANLIFSTLSIITADAPPPPPPPPPVDVPEPASLSMLALGIGVLGWTRRRRSARAK